MSKKSKLFALAISTLMAVAFSSTVSAKGYGMAGCGLCSIVIGPEGGIMQIFAATTNGTSYSQTFGITTGTSNCVEDSAAYMKQQQEIFAHVNYKGLEQEMAAGKGEKLDAFANLLGCPADKLATVGQKNHSDFFAAGKSNPARLISSVRANTELTSACTNL